MKTQITISAILFFLLACTHSPIIPPVVDPPDQTPSFPEGTSPIPYPTQRDGNSAAGEQYLKYGDVVSYGIPFGLFASFYSQDPNNTLNRSGDNQNIPPNYTAVDAPNGVRVVTPNCYQCHAQRLRGDYIVGLGNSLEDYTSDQSAPLGLVDIAVQLTYGPGSSEWEAYEPFSKAIKATGPHLITAARGVNPADKLAAVLAAHRNPTDLTWLDQPQFPIPQDVLPTDIPAWWLLKKKNAMFYTSAGRGDFARFMMSASILALDDSSKAREVDQHFADVLAYLKSLQPPSYPEAIDATLAAAGEKVFLANCATCHGTYGDSVSYPNLLVSLAKVGTDSLLAKNYEKEEDYLNWFNQGWFGQRKPQAELLVTDGYIAPPLDGIWATAPYLHNGSVPDLNSLLNSSTRPTFWLRSFNNQDYDLETVGWKYTRETSPSSTDTYNTSLPGYGNQGHTFGDKLTDQERTDLIVYLKSL